MNDLACEENEGSQNTWTSSQLHIDVSSGTPSSLNINIGKFRRDSNEPSPISEDNDKTHDARSSGR